MKINRIVRLYLSPDDSIRRIVQAVVEGMGDYETLELNGTSFDSRWMGAVLTEGDVAVIGMPVCYGRAPKILAEFFRYIEARKIPAVVVAVCGNRDYEDALLELVSENGNHGFLPVAAGAFIGQHSFTGKLGTGYPDGDGLTLAREFGERAVALLAGTEDPAAPHLMVKGNYPYTPGPDLPLALVTDMEECAKCMACQISCPIQAINPPDVSEVGTWRCLDCGRCMSRCPVGAKSMINPVFREKIIVMEAMFTSRRQPELYYAGSSSDTM